MTTKGLCEICFPKQWKTVSTDMLTDTGYPVYGANGVIGRYSEYNHEEPTLLVTCRGATCGTLNICEPYSYVNGNAMALDNLTDEVDIKYLYYYLLNRGFEDVITGSAQPQIVRQSLQKVKVTYPDKERQLKAVAVLERVNLIKYIPRHVVTYITNFSDEVLNMEWKESELENDDLKNYKMKVEFYVRQNQDNAVIAKLRTNQPLTGADIKVLEDILWSELGTKQDYENEYGSKPLGEFVREIVGLDMNAAKEAFAEYLNDATLDSCQIYFVNQIVEYIVHNGLMKDLSVLQDAPFTDNGSIVEVFTDLTVWMGIRKIIDRINANAVAA